MPNTRHQDNNAEAVELSPPENDTNIESDKNNNEEPEKNEKPKRSRTRRSTSTRKKTTKKTEAKEDTDTGAESSESSASKRSRSRSRSSGGRSRSRKSKDESAEQEKETADESQESSSQAKREDDAKPRRTSRGGSRRSSRSRSSSAKSKEAEEIVDDEPTGSRQMLVNAAQNMEVRIALVENGKLEELYTERAGSISHVGNIYKGRVTNVEPSIQACFIDFGIGQNGFLHISDLSSSYFPEHGGKERVGRKRPRRERPPIQDCLRRGQEVIVQVTKEGIGTKGPTLTTYLSIPGRFLVLMPGMNRMGVSRKIDDEQARLKVRELLRELNAPKDMGFIIRTAGVERPKRDIQRDMNYLLRLWESVNQQIKSAPAPTELYRESDLVIRTLRDIFNSNIKQVTCDTETTVKKVRDFLSVAMPRTRCKVNLYEGETPIFKRYRIEEEIERIQSRHVPLPGGGSLVIDPTEALIAIDVNSGKFRVHDDAEMTAYKINMVAAPEIARQLRLRDLGGVIVMDFIDMLVDKHRRAVEKCLREAIAKDRARTKILRMSQFGIIEMTRQRMRPSLKRSIFMDCPHCKGSGMIKTPESMSIELMRQLTSQTAPDRIASMEMRVSHPVATFLLNHNRAAITALEAANDVVIRIEADLNLANDEVHFITRDSRGSIIEASE